MTEPAQARADPPRITIGMPVRNCAATLPAALRSILAQTYVHWELLLLDDGSSDATREVASGFNDPRIRLISDGSNEGLARRLNQALRAARGEYFARMDGDDICYPRRLERQVAFLDEQPAIDLVATGAMVFSASGAALGLFPSRHTHAAICARPWAGFYFPHPSWMGRTTWFRRFGYCDGALRAQDQDLLLRTYRHSRFATVPEVLLGYRQEHLALGRILRGRYHFTRALLRELRAGRDWRLARGLIGQPVKALADITALTTGTGGLLHRHRALPPDDRSCEEWAAVWQRFSGEP